MSQTALDDFRAEAREFLDANCPDSMRNRAIHFEDAYKVYQTDDAHAWLQEAP